MPMDNGPGFLSVFAFQINNGRFLLPYKKHEILKKQNEALKCSTSHNHVNSSQRTLLQRKGRTHTTSHNI